MGFIKLILFIIMYLQLCVNVLYYVFDYLFYFTHDRNLLDSNFIRVGCGLVGVGRTSVDDGLTCVG